MTSNEFTTKLKDLGFEEQTRGTLTKNYLVDASLGDTPKNKLEMIYKINKEMVNVFYVTYTGKRKVYKARIKHLTLDTDGNIQGLKRI